MLVDLSINNFALIDGVSFVPSQGLSTITGETGAGKSILLGALGLILGERADRSMFYNNEKKCVIEGRFNLEALDLVAFFEENDLDYEADCIVRREIHPSGKTRMFVNDSPVSLVQLKQLGSKLVDIHSQHQSLDIKNSNFQLWALDQIAENQSLLANYQEEYKQYTIIKSRLSVAVQEQADSEKERDYNQYLFNELENLNWKKNEEVSLEEDLNHMENAEGIVNVSSAVANAISGDEHSITDRLSALLNELKSVANVHSGVQHLKAKITELNIDLGAYAAELQDVADSTEVDEKRLNELNERFDTLNNQLKKHNVSSSAELLEIQEELSNKLLSIHENREEIEALEIALEKCLTSLRAKANELQKNRKKSSGDFAKSLELELLDLGMPGAKLVVEMEELEDLGPLGIDKVNFLFNANPGQSLQPIHKGASGGEISRVVFALKKILSTKVSLPTLILDEIDTGISGEIAAKMGQKMKEMSNHLQLIVITHLPQVASKGDSHYYVYKEHGENSSKSSIKMLSEEERVDVLAKMLSGETTSMSALDNARDLLNSN